MNESEQDSFLAEWVLDGYEQGESRNMYGWALSAVQKIFPRVKLKTAWKVLDVWSSLVPVRQAPAAPPELIQAMVIMATLLNRPQLGLLILLCFVGLLRVREALALTQADLILQTDCVVLCLGLTKRGMEQKVVLNNVTVVHFVSDFFKRFPSKRQDAKIIEVSYSSALRWIRKLSALLGADDLQLTTHSFRRSGASELARQGVSLQDILLYGRWLSERAARDYIRKGEVAIFRARQMLNPQASQRIQSWAKLGVGCWQWFDVFYAKRELVIDVRKVTVDKLYAVERILFSGPDGWWERVGRAESNVTSVRAEQLYLLMISEHNGAVSLCCHRQYIQNPMHVTNKQLLRLLKGLRPLTPTPEGRACRNQCILRTGSCWDRPWKGFQNRNVADFTMRLFPLKRVVCESTWRWPTVFSLTFCCSHASAPDPTRLGRAESNVTSVRAEQLYLLMISEHNGAVSLCCHRQYIQNPMHVTNKQLLRLLKGLRPLTPTPEGRACRNQCILRTGSCWDRPWNFRIAMWQISQIYIYIYLLNLLPTFFWGKKNIDIYFWFHLKIVIYF